MNRITVLVDDPGGKQRQALQDRLHFVRDQLNERTFGSVFEPGARKILSAGVQTAGATEGSVWLVAPEKRELVMVHNTGANAARLVGAARQPLAEGIIAMVFSTQQSFVENDSAHSRTHSKLVDRQFQQATLAMIAVPFFLFEDCVGVVSCVKLGQQGEAITTVFSVAALHAIEHAASVTGRLVEYQMLRRCTGLSE